VTVLLINAPIFCIPELLRAPSSTHLQLLFSHLNAFGVETRIVDPVVDMGTPGVGQRDAFCDALGDRLRQEDFSVAGVSCWLSAQLLGARWVGDVLREARPDTVIVVGGTHATVASVDFLGPNTPFDLVVTGQAETTLLDIARNPRRPSAATVVRGKHVPLDEIRFDWSYPYRLASLYTSRGCPFKCAFCVEPADGHDAKGVEHAVEEYQRAADASEDGFVHLQDACFGVVPAWRKSFLRAICDLPRTVRPDLETRADLLDDEDIELLGTARARVLFGVESGSPQMLRWMGKTRDPDRYLARTREVLAACDRHGVEYMLSVLYNHPGETRATLRESIDFFWRLLWDGPSQNLSSLNVHRFAWYPGTRLEPALDTLRAQHGTIVHHPGWWRTFADDHQHEAEHVTASGDLSPELADEMAERLRVAQFLCRARGPSCRNSSREPP
jgi:hypothetical protein